MIFLSKKEPLLFNRDSFLRCVTSLHFPSSSTVTIFYFRLLLFPLLDVLYLFPVFPAFLAALSFILFSAILFTFFFYSLASFVSSFLSFKYNYIYELNNNNETKRKKKSNVISSKYLKTFVATVF